MFVVLKLGAFEPLQSQCQSGAQHALAVGRHMKEQPSGTRGRRHISRADREKVVNKAQVAKSRGIISEKAHVYLTQWAQGTLRRYPRPTECSFLKHRIPGAGSYESRMNPHYAAGHLPRPVVIAVNPAHGPPLSHEDSRMNGVG